MSNKNVEKMCAFKPAKYWDQESIKSVTRKLCMYLVLHHVRYMLKSSM